MQHLIVAPAATVVLLREAPGQFEVLLVQRAQKLAFHGGEWVFPGGRVDPQDGAEPDSLESARAAAVREAREEAGVEVTLAELVPYSHWTTPEGRPRRFATWFFLAPFDRDDVVVDGGEIHAHRWLTPTAAIAARSAGELSLPPPTFVTLSLLSAYTRRDDAMQQAARTNPPVYVPRPRLVQSGVYSLYQGDIAYDGGEVDTEGPRHRLVMDASGYRYQRD